MARRTFFDIISSGGFDAESEYNTLEFLFGIEPAVSIGGYLNPLITYVDRTYFRQLPIRGTCTDIHQMISRLERTRYSSPLERLYVFCEFLIAVLPEERTKMHPQAYEQACTIIQNITAILEQTNHELCTLSNSQTIIVEKNPHTTQAVQLVKDASIALQLLEYNHFALEGNLAEKQKILVSLGQYLEPLLRSHKLQHAGYGQLESDMGFLLNKFHIRHNNKDGQNAQEYIQKISNTDLEEWYDKAYNTALAVIISEKQIDISTDLSTLKNTYKWKG